MTQTSANRISIYLKSVHTQEATLAQFGQCIANYFGFAEAGSGYVGITYEKDQLTIFGLKDGTVASHPQAVLLRHATVCPVHLINKSIQYPTEVKARGVGLGVAILLTSLEGSVLVTRRAAHLRTFPGVWVPPGGHIEPGETLLAAGLRELHEETGLSLKSSSPHHVLGLWESVYPPRLEWGDPFRQHIVVYLAIKSPTSSKELSEQIKLDLEETDAAMWLPASFVEKLSTGNSVEEIPQYLSVVQQTEEGKKNEVQIEAEPILQMIGPPPNSSQLDMERLSWGTRFALQQWTKWDRNTAKL